MSRFRAAVREGTYEALVPTVTAADVRGIQERLARKLPISGWKTWRDSSRRRFRSPADAAPSRSDAEPEFNVTLTDADRARLDVEPLLSFRRSVYMVREDGDWKVDLTLTLRRMREPRPKEEIVSVCRQALRGIAEDADLVETEHFLIFAHTGPVPAQTAAHSLEELYDNFQQVFPFDLGVRRPAGRLPLSRPPEPTSRCRTRPDPIHT